MRQWLTVFHVIDWMPTCLGSMKTTAWQRGAGGTLALRGEQGVEIARRVAHEAVQIFLLLPQLCALQPQVGQQVARARQLIPLLQSLVNLFRQGL